MKQERRTPCKLRDGMPKFTAASPRVSLTELGLKRKNSENLRGFRRRSSIRFVVDDNTSTEGRFLWKTGRRVAESAWGQNGAKLIN